MVHRSIKRNPNIVPEQILWFTKDKWNQIEESGKTLREVIYENSNKRGRLTDEEIENIKKNRVTVVHGESNDSSARYVQDVPRSPLINSISQNGENTTPNYSISGTEDDLPIRGDIYGKDISLDLPIRSELNNPPKMVHRSIKSKWKCEILFA